MIDNVKPRLENLYERIFSILQETRHQILRNINQAMVYSYFEIGRMIIEEEQQGNERARYGQELIKILSEKLTKEFGKGFTIRNLELIRQFYYTYSNAKGVITLAENQKTKSVISQSKDNKKQNFYLGWTHYIKLMRIENEDERNFYEIEAINNNWSVRELNRQFDSALYERLVLSKDKKGIKELSKKGNIIENPKDTIKDPLILEFLGLKNSIKYSETELEQRIINRIEDFLLELGKGFTFVARQKRITIDDSHFFIDLVFYNRLLRCFVVIDLKIGELKHQDIGQIQMYVNYYDRFVKSEDENPTIGIILCKDKKQTLIEITLPENNNQIFASKYELILPSKETLRELIESKNIND